MKSKKDPRLADITKGGRKKKVAPAPPEIPPTRPVPPRTKNSAPTKERIEPIRTSRGPKWSKRPEWLSSLLKICGALLFAYLIWSGFGTIASTLKGNQDRQTISDVWRQLLIANVKIQGTPTGLNADGNATFSSVSMENVKDRLSIHRNLRLATALPGIQSVNISPEYKREIGAGYADDSTLQLVANSFPVLDSLDISATRITSVNPLADITVRELKLINTTIKREKLPVLEMLNSVTDVWIGWDYDDRKPENAIYTSPAYKAQVLDTLSKMKSLKNLYLYQMTFDTEELKKLSGINIVKL